MYGTRTIHPGISMIREMPCKGGRALRMEDMRAPRLPQAWAPSTAALFSTGLLSAASLAGGSLMSGNKQHGLTAIISKIFEHFHSKPLDLFPAHPVVTWLLCIYPIN